MTREKENTKRRTKKTKNNLRPTSLPSQSRTDAVSVITALIGSAPHLIRMSSSLAWIYLTLGWRVRKARRAFEKQITQQGMSKADAQRLSACYADLKNSITAIMKQGVSGSLIRNIDDMAQE